LETTPLTTDPHTPGETEVKGGGDLLGGAETDEDFLARERAALGDDADQFATPADNLARVDGGDDLLGDAETYGRGSAANEEVDEFESSYPAIDNRNQVCPDESESGHPNAISQQVGPGGSITGTGPTSYTNYTAPQEEPEVIR
jgi:hypothetical protein